MLVPCSYVLVTKRPFSDKHICRRDDAVTDMHFCYMTSRPFLFFCPSLFFYESFGTCPHLLCTCHQINAFVLCGLLCGLSWVWVHVCERDQQKKLGVY